ncbi:MAG TPA: hypothetical protein VEX69_01290 [Candidatus Limnocylindria bacterium]|nr:hypothetical protein [Candidatus Limnocylindria bacterium]
MDSTGLASTVTTGIGVVDSGAIADSTAVIADFMAVVNSTATVGFTAAMSFTAGMDSMAADRMVAVAPVAEAEVTAPGVTNRN